MTKSISSSFDADLFSQKVEGYEATGVNAKRSRGTFARVKGHVATFLSLDACDNTFKGVVLMIFMICLASIVDDYQYVISVLQHYSIPRSLIPVSLGHLPDIMDLLTPPSRCRKWV